MGMRGPKPIYLWSEWFARPVFTAIRGKHYKCSTRSFVQQARNAAASLGVALHVSHSDGVVYLSRSFKEVPDAQGR